MLQDADNLCPLTGFTQEVTHCGDHINVTETLELTMHKKPLPEDGLPVVLMADFNDGTSKTVASKLQENGEVVVLTQADISASAFQEIKQAKKVADQASNIFDKLTKGMGSMGKAFGQVAMAGAMLADPLIGAKGGGYNGKRMGKKWVSKRKSRSKMQSRSRKANRS